MSCTNCLPVLLALACLDAVAAVSLCGPAEAVVFSCVVEPSRKTASLCASPDLGEDRGHLAYRFGTQGRIELEFPRRGTPSSAEQFRYAHYFRSQVDRTEISFSVGEYSYTVFSYFDGEAKPANSEGVRVVRGKVKREFRCTGRSSANFTKLERAVPCDEGNALATCP
jgi:hypothetical protein